jgi:hypothetical protein
MEKSEFLKLKPGDNVKLKKDLINRHAYDGLYYINDRMQFNGFGIVISTNYEKIHIKGKYMYGYTNEMLEQKFKYGK